MTSGEDRELEGFMHSILRECAARLSGVQPEYSGTTGLRDQLELLAQIWRQKYVQKVTGGFAGVGRVHRRREEVFKKEDHEKGEGKVTLGDGVVPPTHRVVFSPYPKPLWNPANRKPAAFMAPPRRPKSAASSLPSVGAQRNSKRPVVQVKSVGGGPSAMAERAPKRPRDELGAGSDRGVSNGGATSFASGGAGVVSTAGGNAGGGIGNGGTCNGGTCNGKPGNGGDSSSRNGVANNPDSGSNGDGDSSVPGAGFSRNGGDGDGGDGGIAATRPRSGSFDAAAGAPLSWPLDGEPSGASAFGDAGELCNGDVQPLKPLEQQPPPLPPSPPPLPPPPPAAAALAEPPSSGSPLERRSPGTLSSGVYKAATNVTWMAGLGDEEFVGAFSGSGGSYGGIDPNEHSEDDDVVNDADGNENDIEKLLMSDDDEENTYPAPPVAGSGVDAGGAMGSNATVTVTAAAAALVAAPADPTAAAAGSAAVAAAPAATSISPVVASPTLAASAVTTAINDGADGGMDVDVWDSSDARDIHETGSDPAALSNATVVGVAAGGGTASGAATADERTFGGSGDSCGSGGSSSDVGGGNSGGGGNIGGGVSRSADGGRDALKGGDDGGSGDGIRDNGGCSGAGGDLSGGAGGDLCVGAGGDLNSGGNDPAEVDRDDNADADDSGGADDDIIDVERYVVRAGEPQPKNYIVGRFSRGLVKAPNDMWRITLLAGNIKVGMAEGAFSRCVLSAAVDLD
ncbi:unnamed protein product [Phaeothamnion confervicola]